MTALDAKLTGAITYNISNYTKATVGANDIYQNSIVGIDETDRLMYPWGTAGKTLEFAGFAVSTYETGDTGYASKRATYITAYEGSALTVTGITAITDEGSLLYCSTDNWTEDLTIVATGSPIGRISKFVDTALAEVEFYPFDDALVASNLAVAGDLEVSGDTTINGLFDSVLDATESWSIDADTTDHTGANIFAIDLGINSASVNAIQINLDVGTALSAAELGKGFYIDANAKAADADTSGILGYDGLYTAISTSRADLFGFRATFDGTQDGADTTTGISIVDTQTQATSTFKGLLVDGTGYTHTSGDWYGFDIQNTVVTTAGNSYGGRILVDMTDDNNAKNGLLISKDLTSTAGATTQSNSALSVASVNANTHASIMTVSNVLANFAETNSAAAAGADVYSGNMVNLAYSATTATAGTATSDKTAFNIDYNLTETAGTLSLTAFNVATIDYDTTGTVSYATGSYNLFNINGTDANVPAYAANSLVNGLNVDISAMDISDADLTLSGLRVAMPAGATTSTLYGAIISTGVDGVALYVDAATTDHVAGNIIHIEADVDDVAAGSFASFYTSIDESAIGTDGTYIVGSDTIITGFSTGRADLIGSRITLDGTKDGGDASIGMLINADSLTLNNASETLSLVKLDASSLTNTASSAVYGLEILGGLDYGINSAGWNKFDYVDQSKYYWCEDFDEEASGVQLMAGLRADEWTAGGTGGADAHTTYIQAVGGAIQSVAAATDDNSDWTMGLDTKFNTDNSLIFEARFKTDAVITNFVCVGLVEGSFDDKGTYDDDMIVVGMDTDNAHTFGADQAIIVSNNNNAGAIVDDGGVAIASNTYVTVRIDLTDLNQPRVYINNTGGAITPANEVAAASITGTVQSNIWVMPYFHVQNLAGVVTNAITVDYIKVWSNRA